MRWSVIRYRSSRAAVHPEARYCFFTVGLCLTIPENLREALPCSLSGCFRISAVKWLPADPCPLFIAADQPEIPGKASDLFALWTKNNLPCEIHAFTDSSHGFGYRPNGRSENMWITLFVNFMQKVHLID